MADFNTDEQRVLVTMLKASPRSRTFDEIRDSEDRPQPDWTDLAAALDAVVSDDVLEYGRLGGWGVDGSAGEQFGYRLVDVGTADRVWVGDFRRRI